MTGKQEKPATKSQEREKRLAEALRANLKRRKAAVAPQSPPKTDKPEP
jgi:hypothetical protein